MAGPVHDGTTRDSTCDRSAPLLLSDKYTQNLKSRAGPFPVFERPWAAQSHAPQQRAQLTMRKRHSFFGRASSDAGSTGRMSTSHSTLSSQTRPEPLSRPGTAMTETRRRKTEPLEQIRNSIFGGRKKNSPPSSRDGSSAQGYRPPSRAESLAPGDATLPREHFTSEADYYRYLRKTSISPPFNFEHVTHTAKQQLPPLETVDEQDLPGQFWSVSAYQRPKKHLNGIKADDLSDKLPALGIERGSPSSRPSSPVLVELPTDRARLPGSMGSASGINETIFDELSETSFDPGSVLRNQGQPQKQSQHPKRKSSLIKLNDQRLKYLSLLGAPEQKAPETDPAEEIRPLNEGVKRVTSRGRQTPHMDAVPEELERAVIRRASSLVDRSRTPLPPVPRPASSADNDRDGRQIDEPASTLASPLASSELSCSSQSWRSSRPSSTSVIRSPAVSDTSNSSTQRPESVLSDATWEDDVEFCYQHEAESTCNFDWQVNESTHQPSVVDGSIRKVGSTPATPSPLAQSERPDSPEVPVEIYQREPVRQTKRHPSVGHRGFLAARTDSVLGKQRHLAPHNLEFAPKAGRVSILSPVFSIAGSDKEGTVSPLSPISKHIHDFDGIQRVSAEYLSDPESSATSISRDRTSSSCSSYDAASRPTLDIVRGPGRWSLTSNASVPELLHSSKRRSNTAPQQSTITQRIGSVRRKPTPTTFDRPIPTDVHPAFRDEPLRGTFVLRSTSSSAELRTPQPFDTSAMPRSRPPTPSRFSRLLAPTERRTEAPDESLWL